MCRIADSSPAPRARSKRGAPRRHRDLREQRGQAPGQGGFGRALFPPGEQTADVRIHRDEHQAQAQFRLSEDGGEGIDGAFHGLHPPSPAIAQADKPGPRRAQQAVRIEPGRVGQVVDFREQRRLAEVVLGPQIDEGVAVHLLLVRAVQVHLGTVFGGEHGKQFVRGLPEDVAPRDVGRLGGQFEAGVPVFSVQIGVVGLEGQAVQGFPVEGAVAAPVAH